MQANNARAMRAAVYKAKGQPLVVEQIPIPRPGPGQVLVKVKACGIGLDPRKHSDGA
jgi:D-arabinose 1-dehydrogenase-like Zn-dependent alcohol dehydrogenase